MKLKCSRMKITSKLRTNKISTPLYSYYQGFDSSDDEKEDYTIKPTDALVVAGIAVCIIIGTRLFEFGSICIR
jgi:hypothetical protein